MYEDIKKNKIKTGIIISIFLISITCIIYYICMAFDLGSFSIVIAMIFSIASCFGSYYYSDRIILSLNHARPATNEENKKLINILDALVVSSGLSHTPKLYIIEDKQPNAFATGRNPENSVICITTGLLEKLDYYELEGVIAHELAHIKNYDIRLSAVVTVLVGFVVMFCDFISRSLFWIKSDSDNDSKSNGIAILVSLILLVITPIFSSLMQLAISRRREFLADATAIQFTRNPNGLISALKKLDDDPNQLQYANNSTSHMYIVDPFKSNLKDRKKTSIFSTHPSISDRIHALETLK